MSKIIIQFNEANFDFISKYCEKYSLPNLKKILEFETKIITSSEDKYENLEPWIQWYSFYTGLKYEEHQVAHLGDCLKKQHISCFDKQALNKKKVGLFSSMNHKFNDKFQIFIPDPWTETFSDNSFSSKLVSYALKFIINNNVRFKINFYSLLGIFFIIFPSLLDLKSLLNALLSFLKKDRASLAAYFDLFFLKYCLRRAKKNNLDESIILLNGLAHVQHHFLKTSEFSTKKKQEDLIYKSLKIYDKAFSFLKKLNNSEIWFITGLTQEEFEDDLNYWRLRNHEEFFKKLIDKNFVCFPRMTRDFELVFNNDEDAYVAKKVLSQCFVLNNKKKDPAFGFFDLKNNILFGSFVYSGNESDVELISLDKKILLDGKIDFIAKKDGGHLEKGWVFTNRKLNFENKHSLPIWELNKLIFD